MHERLTVIARSAKAAGSGKFNFRDDDAGIVRVKTAKLSLSDFKVKHVDYEEPPN